MKANFKSAANAAWKVENFGMFAVIRYIQKSKETNLVNFCKEKEINRSEITIDLLKSKMKARELNKVDKAGTIIEPRQLFSLWTVLTALARK